MVRRERKSQSRNLLFSLVVKRLASRKHKAGHCCCISLVPNLPGKPAPSHSIIRSVQDAKRSQHHAPKTRGRFLVRGMAGYYGIKFCLAIFNILKEAGISERFANADFCETSWRRSQCLGSIECNACVARALHPREQNRPCIAFVEKAPYRAKQSQSTARATGYFEPFDHEMIYQIQAAAPE